MPAGREPRVPVGREPRVPAEWEPHAGTIMCWPTREEIWSGLRDRAAEDHAVIASAIARFEPVTMIAPPHLVEEAERTCGPGIRVLELPIDDSWARDSGPIQAVTPDGARVVVGVSFNSWGRKYLPYDEDARLARRWAALRGEPVLDAHLVLEGGSITVDGLGTVVTTEQCLLHPSRNPSLTRAAIEDRLTAALGARTVVWLPHGLVLDHDTDGHVDNVAAFVRPGLVLAQGCDDPDEPDHERLGIDLRCLRDAPDARGEPIDVVEVPVLPFTELAGRRIVVPYLNLYLCNGAAVVPVCGHPADDDMLALIGEQLPGREVVPVPGAVLAVGGGGPHCITQQIPRVPSDPPDPPGTGSAAAGTSDAVPGLG